MIFRKSQKVSKLYVYPFKSARQYLKRRAKMTPPPMDRVNDDLVLSICSLNIKCVMTLVTKLKADSAYPLLDTSFLLVKSSALDHVCSFALLNLKILFSLGQPPSPGTFEPLIGKVGS